MLFHYSKEEVKSFCTDRNYKDYPHNPGGFWLSDDSDYGLA